MLIGCDFTGSWAQWSSTVRCEHLPRSHGAEQGLEQGLHAQPAACLNKMSTKGTCRTASSPRELPLRLRSTRSPLAMSLASASALAPVMLHTHSISPHSSAPLVSLCLTCKPNKGHLPECTQADLHIEVNTNTGAA